MLKSAEKIRESEMLAIDDIYLGVVEEVSEPDGSNDSDLKLVGRKPLIGIPSDLPPNLVGKTVVVWSGLHVDDTGIDEVRVLDDGRVHFLFHLVGEVGYTINFFDEYSSLRFLEYLGAEILLPTYQPARAS